MVLVVLSTIIPAVINIEVQTEKRKWSLKRLNITKKDVGPVNFHFQNMMYRLLIHCPFKIH
jgi:hypothetical protein